GGGRARGEGRQGGRQGDMSRISGEIRAGGQKLDGVGEKVTRLCERVIRLEGKFDMVAKLALSGAPPPEWGPPPAAAAETPADGVNPPPGEGAGGRPAGEQAPGPQHGDGGPPPDETPSAAPNTAARPQ
ncbi:MAG: hypothetical protein OXD41_01575, partial [Thaumarchaeota archaeon]|nr:hypothetical protein [Nitrososphaerota archaeon]